MGPAATPFSACSSCPWVGIYVHATSDWLTRVPDACPACGGELTTDTASPAELDYLAQRVRAGVEAELGAGASQSRPQG